MGLSPEFLEGLKSRVQLSSYIGTRVKLKRQGRHMSGCCPFHSEKSPSFIVSDDKGTYHCFGCGAHGDIISFLQQSENLNFIEAVQKIADTVGVTLPQYSKQTPEKSEKIKDIYDLLEEAASFFQSYLKSNEGLEGRRYLEKRGISPQIQEQFRLGFSPTNNGFKSYFLEKGYTERKLLDAGLLSQNEDKTRCYDRFRSRLMFPIWDRRGKVVAFGGRTLGDDQPKYLNSPETEVFHKNRILYGYHLARLPAIDSKQVIVCEGYLDVITLYQGGFKNAVAPLGTAIGEEQIKILWNLTPTPTLCFDGDTAGQKAAYRAIERSLPLLKAGFSLQFAHLPVGEDPDSLIQSGSIDRLTSILQTTTPLVDVLWMTTLKSHSLNTPENRAKFEKDLMALVDEMKDPTVKASYRETFRNRIRELFRSRSSRTGTNFQPNFISLAQVKPNINAFLLQQKILLAGLINHPVLLEEYYETFLEFDLNNCFHRLKDELILKINEDHSFNAGKLQHHLYNNGFADLLDDILCNEVYKHASFVKPDVDIQTARQGWLEIWFHLQNTKKVADQVDAMNKKFQLSTSSLLKAKMRGDFT